MATISAPLLFYSRKRKRSAQTRKEASSLSGKKTMVCESSSQLARALGEEEKELAEPDEAAIAPTSASMRCCVRRRKPSCTRVPNPVLVSATLLKPPPMEALRRSARCLNRPRAPIYAEREEPKQSTGHRSLPKRKRDHDPAAEAQVAVKVAMKTVKAEPKERKLIPISATAFAGAAVGKGKSAKLRVKETLRAFSSHCLHHVQEEQKRAQAVIQAGTKGGWGRIRKSSLVQLKIDATAL